MDWKTCCNYLGISDKRDIPLGKWVVDSRACEKNSLFVALKGKKSDGHHFLKEVAQRGSFGAIVSEDYQGEDFGLNLVKVKDPLKTLQNIASQKRIDKGFFVIGITGSVGKTTTKEFCYALLRGHKNVDKSTGSYNGQIGLPLSILNAKEHTEVLILEMGMSQKKEMSNLVQIARPNLVILTRIAAVHPEAFLHVGEIAYEKGQLLTSPLFEYGWIHQVSSNFDEIKQLVQEKAFESYSLDVVYPKDATNEFCKGNNIPLNPCICLNNGIQVQEKQGETPLIDRDHGSYRFDMDARTLTMEKQTLSVPFKEEHFVENLVPAILLARYFGISWQTIQQDVLTLKPFDHRFQTWVLRDVTLIDDTFNNNPVSMKAVMKNLSRVYVSGRLIGVLGEMADLGKDSQKLHEEIAEEAAVVFDEVFCYGQETTIFKEVFSRHGKKVEHFSDLELLTQKLQREIRKYDTVFVKGKNANRLWKIVESLKDHLENGISCSAR